MPIISMVRIMMELGWMGETEKEIDDLAAMAAMVRSKAQQYQGDSQKLLSLLRLLEELHREIRTHQFEPFLPNSRHELYGLLRDIEETGGWPYIERMRLRTFFSHFFPDKLETSSNE